LVISIAVGQFLPDDLQGQFTVKLARVFLGHDAENGTKVGVGIGAKSGW
jgi:hypothetical protein